MAPKVEGNAGEKSKGKKLNEILTDEVWMV
jgi:hypothetical protein